MASDEPDARGAGSRDGVDGAGSEAAPAPRGPNQISRGRWILVNTLIGITTLLLVVAIFAVWANRLLLNPDNWANTSTQLLQNPQIRSTAANYIVDQLYANVNVADLIRSGLPPRFEPLAAPAAGALRNVAVQGTELALQRPRVQNLWAQANRAADQTLVAIVEGRKGTVSVNQGAVTLNLAAIVDNIAARLGLPPDISAKLPPDVANLTIFRSDQLKFVQNVGNGIKGLALWLTILCPVLYALAIVLAPGRRRRALMNVGLAAVLAGVLVLLGRSILQSQIVNSITHDASLRPTVEATISIGTAIINEIAVACIVVGVPLFIAGWFAGPGRAPRAGRRAIAPFLREHAAESYAIALGVMVLIFIWNPIHATGTPAGIIVFTVLAMIGVFVLRRQTMEEFPDARLGEATERLRARVRAMRGRSTDAEAASAQNTIPQQLQHLADLRDHGAISADEYQAAKAQLLHT
jgi:hypothetical protein